MGPRAGPKGTIQCPRHDHLASPRGRARPRARPHHRGPLGGPAAGRPGRRRDQGGAARRGRPVAGHAGGHRGQLPLPEPQQALDRDRPQGLGGRPGPLPAPRRGRRTWSSTTSPTAPSRAWAWATTCWRGCIPASSTWPSRASSPALGGAALPRRARADVGRARLHDRAARPAPARGRLDRGRGRGGLRRDRGPGRAPSAGADRPRPEDHLGPLRDRRLLGRPVARPARGHRPAVGADAGDPPGHAHGLGRVPALHRGGRRAGLHRHHVQRPLGALLRRVRAQGSPRRRAPGRQRQARRRARLAARAHRGGDAPLLEHGAVRAARALPGAVRAAATPRSAPGRRAPAGDRAAPGHPAPRRRIAKLPKLPVHSTAFDMGLQRPAPTLGEHTREVLRELGLETDEIDALASRRVIA